MTGRGAHVVAAWAGGLRKLWLAKRWVVALYLCNLALALVLGSVVYESIREDLGSSLAGERMTEGFDSLWHDGFSTRASGAAGTFRPSVTGAGAVFDALDASLDGFGASPGRPGLRFGPRGSGVQGIVLLYLLLSCFFGAGLLARFTGREHTSFLSGAVLFFPRVLVLSATGLAVYWLIFGPLRAILDARVAGVLHDEIDERVRFAWTLAEYLLLWGLSSLTGLVIGLVEVATVKQGRIALGQGLRRGLHHGLRFLGRHPFACLGLHLSLAFVWLATVAVYASIAPGAETASLTAIALTFLLGQALIGAHVALRALTYASFSSLYEALGPASGETASPQGNGPVAASLLP